MTTTHAIPFIPESDETARRFGQHICALRLARGIDSQALLARLCRPALATITIKRLEDGVFSPSLDTVRSVCAGLGVSLSYLFESFEDGESLEARALMALGAGRPAADLALAVGVVRALFDGLDAARSAAAPGILGHAPERHPQFSHP